MPAREGAAGTVPSYRVRHYRPADRPQVLDLLASTLSRWPRYKNRDAVWGWKHFDNPFGASSIFVAESREGKVLGLSTLMRWRVRRGDETIQCVRSVDLATHRDHRRQGIASAFWGPALGQIELDAPGLAFHTANRISYTISMRRGRKRIGYLRSCVRVASYPRCAARWIRGTPRGCVFRHPTPSVADLLADPAAVADLLEADRATSPDRLRTDHTVDYLRWRYADHPELGYHAVCSERGSKLEACAIFRVDSHRSISRVVLQDVFLRRPESEIVRGIKRVLDEHVAPDVLQYLSSESRWLPELLGRRRPARSPFGYNFLVRVLDPRLGEAALRVENWALTSGDLQEI